MATVTVLNTSSNISGDTLLTAENNTTVTGLITFDRDPSAPFAVSANSSVVANLDADKVDGKNSTDLLLLDGTQSMTGNLNLGSNGQIVFPASQNAAAGANTLDDYEEGTFTPTITGTGGGSGQAYTTQTGHYIKIGKMVHVQGRITLSTLGTVTTQGAVGGLPFTAQTGTFSILHIGYFGSFTSSFAFISGVINGNTTIASLYGTTGGVGLGGLVQADFSNTSDIIFSGNYQASA